MRAHTHTLEAHMQSRQPCMNPGLELPHLHTNGERYIRGAARQGEIKVNRRVHTVAQMLNNGVGEKEVSLPASSSMKITASPTEILTFSAQPVPRKLTKPSCAL